MIARWTQGRAEIDTAIAARQLERVPASRELANRDIALAESRADSAKLLLEAGDASGALTFAYDSARLALTAILANQGLRPTSAGGHLATQQAVLAQLEPPMGRRIRPFDRMRRERNRAQYPSLDDIDPTESDVRDDIATARDLIALAGDVLDSMPVY